MRVTLQLPPCIALRPQEGSGFNSIDDYPVSAFDIQEHIINEVFFCYKNLPNCYKKFTRTSTMRPFTEVLLLLVTAYTLLPLSFANDFHALHSTVKRNALQKGAAIRGLLVVRQSGGCDTGFTSCSATTCCPIAWDCCPGSYLHLFC